MTLEAYEQLWDTSHEFLTKHVTFVHSVTKLMLERASYLRNQLISEARENSTFASDFEKAHIELQHMTKSLQAFVGEWHSLFGMETVNSITEIARQCSVPRNKLTLDCSKPKLEYNLNQKIQLMVTYILNSQQGYFYAMDKSKTEEFANQLTPLQQIPKVLLTRLPSAGTMFILKLDGIWHRAVRTDTTGGQPNLAAVFLVDLGEILTYEEEIPIAELSIELSKVPAYAIKCRLASSDCQILFNLYDTISCKVVATENEHMVVEMSQEKIVAITRDNFTEEELKQLDDSPEGTTNAMKAVLGYVPRDDIEICKHYDPRTKRCFKGSNCKLRHEEKDPEGWTLDKDTVSVAIPAQMEFPLPNSYVQLQPTFIVDVEKFYAQLISNSNNSKAFALLVGTMNDPEIIAEYKPLKLMPSLGELVIAKYEDVWYRATVCDIFEDDVSVFYVDYGNTAIVSAHDVRRWEDRFKFLPYQAICCRIANIRHIKPYHIEAIQQLNYSILDKSLRALVIDNKYPWEVQLFDNEGFDIGKAMVMTKLALPRIPCKFDENAYIPG
ncbi:tudor domain-containing protein 1 [Anopheles nili]|uniref:tudor domain-containing protein 1 n=1 Tax=Anopheles nili TaxID=185578 RepID=UPI00237C0F4C|nr:tudor domain-containing protein 1 [Anopheles nili]